MGFLEKLGRAIAPGKSAPPSEGGAAPTVPGLPAGLVEQHPATARPCLKLPLPKPEVMQELVDVLGARW
jgi:hypothetical protein